MLQTIYERLKLLRKTVCLNQTEFGGKLGVTRSVIKNLELGTVDVKEHMVKLICSVFNVDYIWLTTGEGEMFSEVDNQAMELVDRLMSSENDFTRRVFKAFAAFDEDDWKTLEKFIDNVVAQKNNEKKEAGD